MENLLWKSCHTICVIDFSCTTANQLEEAIHSGVKAIHIFVFYPDHVLANRLAQFSPICRRKKIQLIIHCFYHQDRRYLQKQMKGIKKDKWFHFQLCRSMYVRLSKEKAIRIEHREISVYHEDSSKNQTIQFGI